MNIEILEAAGWVRQPSPTNNDLKNIFFLNNNTGWISGDSGTIAKTTNGGDNWSLQYTGVSNDIQGIYFINERLGWAISWEVFPDSNSFLGTRVLKTTDGGINWISYMYPDTGRFMKTVYFLDSLKGFMAGAPLIIVYTQDAGNRWSRAETDSNIVIGFPVENLKFITSEIGYACGGFRDLAGAMWKTTNGGLFWTSAVIGPEPMNDLYIFSTDKVIAAGGDFEYGSSIVTTMNQGQNWSYQTLGTFGVSTAIDFRTPYEGWITLGVAQKFSYTLDTGATWNEIFTPDSIPILDIQFTDSTHGWAVGYYGALLKYDYTMVNIASSGDNSRPNEFNIYQNYPNPFNPKTTINYELKSSGNISLKIYNALGQNISTLINERQNEGNYTVIFNGENLPSGIYFYEIRTDHYSEVKKMILLK